MIVISARIIERLGAQLRGIFTEPWSPTGRELPDEWNAQNLSFFRHANIMDKVILNCTDLHWPCAFEVMCSTFSDVDALCRTEAFALPAN